MGRNKIIIDAGIENFVQKIKSEFNPKKIILFGSRAYGDAWNYSDYDFIIVSDAFKKYHWLERISNVVKYWDSDKPIDVLPYTLEEFRQKREESRFIKEAVKKGIEV